jgi:uncharacterized damage-inducible protein DinB
MPGLVRPVDDERDALMAYLAQQRHVARIAAYGLTEEQARMTPTPSALSVGGIIKHLAHVERSWIATLQGRDRRDYEAYAASFQLSADDTLQGVLADYELAAAETEAAITGIDDLGRPVPVPKGVPWFPHDVDAWSVRWILLHLIEETARHAGHADIVREAVDGAGAFPLMAAVEGWPESPWMKPWRAHSEPS